MLYSCISVFSAVLLPESLKKLKVYKEVTVSECEFIFEELFLINLEKPKCTVFIKSAVVHSMQCLGHHIHSLLIH